MTQVDAVAHSTFRALCLWIAANATLHIFRSERWYTQHSEPFTQCFVSSATLSYLISNFLCSLPQWMPLLGLRYTNAISQWPTTTTTNGHFFSTPSSITICAGPPGTANFWRRDKWRDLLHSPTSLCSHLISNLFCSHLISNLLCSHLTSFAHLLLSNLLCSPTSLCSHLISHLLCSSPISFALQPPLLLHSLTSFAPLTSFTLWSCFALISSPISFTHLLLHSSPTSFAPSLLSDLLHSPTSFAPQPHFAPISPPISFAHLWPPSLLSDLTSLPSHLQSPFFPLQPPLLHTSTFNSLKPKLSCQFQASFFKVMQWAVQDSEGESLWCQKPPETYN